MIVPPSAAAFVCLLIAEKESDASEACLSGAESASDALEAYLSVTESVFEVSEMSLSVAVNESDVSEACLPVAVNMRTALCFAASVFGWYGVEKGGCRSISIGGGRFFVRTVQLSHVHDSMIAQVYGTVKVWLRETGVYATSVVPACPARSRIYARHNALFFYF